MMRHAARLLVAVLALAALGAPGRAAEQPYEIDVLLGLTGGAAFVGSAARTALQALEPLLDREGGIRGRPVHFAIYDNRSNPQVAVQLANDLIAKHAPVLLVSGLIASCRAVGALVTDGPLEYCLSPALHPKKDSFLFSAGASTRDMMAATLRYFRDRGLRRIATITSTDASGQDADEQLDAVVAQLGAGSLDVVDREHFAPGDVSVSAQIAKIKAADPSVLIAWTAGTPFGTVLRGIKDGGLTIPIATTNGNMIYRQIKEYAGLLPKELYFPGPGYITGQATTPRQRDAQRAFFAAIKSAGGTPDYETGEAWDPALLVVEALRRLGPDASADQIRRFILGVRTYPGISGIYDFTTGDQRGLSDKDVVVMRWDEAKDWWVAASRPGGTPLGR